MTTFATPTSSDDRSMTLLALQQTVQRLVMSSDKTQGVWVTAELSDVAERGGHCYLELIQKDPSTGSAIAKARAMIWANLWPKINYSFLHATGQRFATGLKVRVCVNANYHPLYGMSLVITAVDPNYTMGDLLRLRREILMRLKQEGTLEMNRSLEFPSPTLRIAVISAPGAAGFGDFINQLYHTNDLKFRFITRLFPAVMQGDKAARSVIDALDCILAEQDDWDCVVIIRGGGSTSDLSGFEDYELAANVAQFPLPVIVGIGHERDVTVLDYVARERVKTPTAAAELLTSMAIGHMEHLRDIASGIVQISTECMAGADRQLAYAEGLLPVAPEAAIRRAEMKLTGAMASLGNIGSRLIRPMQTALERTGQAIESALALTLQRRNSRLDTLGELLGALSPEATLRRGYSITRVNGRSVTDASALQEGTVIETTLHHGTISSVVTNQS